MSLSLYRRLVIQNYELDNLLILFNIPVFAEITVYFYEHLVRCLMYHNVTGLRMIWGLFLMITVS
jgi:hypothetical protein